ncbi:MAG: hypothetical protein OET16_00215 [Chromatiales bacterium]|nr:hypothetical protein [Chromatiales bacterium]
MPTVLTLVEPHLAYLSAAAVAHGSSRQRAVLGAMLARASATVAPPTTYESGLYILAGGDSAARVAVAPVTWLHDYGARATADCWRADPAHVRLGSGRDTGVVFGTALALDTREAATFAADIAAALEWPPWKLVAPVADRWYLHDMAWPQIDTATPVEVGQSGFSAALPRGAAAADLRRALSEVQMLLSDHPLNLERVRRGLPAVNSLWFWGGGRGPDPGTGIRCSRLFGEDPFLGGLGRMVEEEMRPLPSPSDEEFWANCRGETLMALSPNVAFAGPGEKAAALERLVCWLTEARRRLLTGRLSELRLADALGRHFCWRRFDPLRIWRRTIPPLGRQQ